MIVVLIILAIALALVVAWLTAKRKDRYWQALLDDKSDVAHAVMEQWRESNKGLERTLAFMKGEVAARDQRIAEQRNEITRLKREVVFTATEVLRNEEIESLPRDEKVSPTEYQQRRAVAKLQHVVGDLVAAKCTTEIEHDVQRARKVIRVEVRLGDLKEGL